VLAQVTLDNGIVRFEILELAVLLPICAQSLERMAQIHEPSRVIGIVSSHIKINYIFLANIKIKKTSGKKKMKLNIIYVPLYMHFPR